MNILLTNDDGINALGFGELVERLGETEHRILVCAPSECQSANSMAITINRALVVENRSLVGADKSFSVDGSSVDCVKIALNNLYKDENIDLVISGINNGFNLGRDMFYSSTVGAAIESINDSVPAISLSTAFFDGDSERPVDAVGSFVKYLSYYIALAKKKDAHYFLNINIPFKGSDKKEFSTVSKKSLYNIFYKKIDGKYQLSGKPTTTSERGSDLDVISRGVTSVSIIKNDFFKTESGVDS